MQPVSLMLLVSRYPSPLRLLLPSRCARSCRQLRTKCRYRYHHACRRLGTPPCPPPQPLYTELSLIVHQAEAERPSANPARVSASLERYSTGERELLVFLNHSGWRWRCHAMPQQSVAN